MKIKNYVCTGCNGKDFFFSEKNNIIGIYCSQCGKWLKWASKDEKNLMILPDTQNENPLLKLIKENPNLPVIPMVDAEVVADDNGYWMGEWGRCEVTEYYLGEERVHFKDDDEEDILNDLAGCRYGYDQQGRDIYELSDDEWNALYQSIPWTKAIVVYITT